MTSAALRMGSGSHSRTSGGSVEFPSGGVLHGAVLPENPGLVSKPLALGGGDGLNFVVRAQGLVKFLLGYSLEQRERLLASA